MRYEKYELGKLANIQKVKGLPLDKYESGHIPYVTGSQSNNGVIGYVKAPDEAISKGNCIAIDPIKGLCMYQPNDFVGRGFSGASINLLYIEKMNELSAMYIIASIEKYSTKVAAYTNLFNGSKLENATIILPTLDELYENSPYSDEGFVPDFNYMQERIAVLEQEHIAELEQYLTTTGLNDYELTDEDIKILSLSGFGDYEKSGSKDAVRVCKEMREFLMQDLFEKPDIKWIAKRKFCKEEDVSTELTQEFNLPLVNAKNGNNGIMYYGRDSDFSYVNGGIDVVSDGAVSAGNVYPQPQRVGILYNAYMVVLKNGILNREVLEYISCVMKKSIKHMFSYSNKATWDKVRKTSIQLPIQTDANNNPVIDPDHTYHPNGYIPDWHFMEKYIHAIEKIMIADVVKYKDSVIIPRVTSTNLA